jgi:hypothetical protein
MEPFETPSGGAARPDIDEDGIRELLTRLGRRHPSGGVVVERAAILASGADCTAVVDWILAHAGQPEVVAAPKPRGGLYGGRVTERESAPRRYVLAAGSLS